MIQQMSPKFWSEISRKTKACLLCLSIVGFNALAPPRLCAEETPKTDAPDKTAFPEWAEVKSAVHQQLKKRNRYQSGDIISREDVARLFSVLEKMGWEVADQKLILERVLSVNDFLVRQLRSKKGVPFMRKISKVSESYDRLDRLRRMPYGKRRVLELIQARGGHTLILYMTTTKGGRNLGRQLSRIKSGRNFNKKTNRIYTEKQLLRELERSYRVEQKKRMSAKKPLPQQ